MFFYATSVAGRCYSHPIKVVDSRSGGERLASYYSIDV